MSRHRAHPTGKVTVSGIELEVSNPALAASLAADAAGYASDEAPGADATTLADAPDVDATTVADAPGADAATLDHAPRVDARTITQAAPEVVIAVPTPRTAAEERARREFRARVAAAGTALGFEVAPDGSWTAADGTLIVTRHTERPLTLAATVYFVREVGTKVRPKAERAGVLFVADSQQTADSFTVAIRQRGSYDLMRAISIDALERMVVLSAAGRLGHDDVVALLAPVAGIDAGTLLTLIERPVEGRP